MTDLIKAADALAEEMRLIEEEAKRTIEWDEEDPIRMLDWFDTKWINALSAYRQARKSAGDGVKVKPLVWECEGGWRWKGTPPDGFFTSVAKWVWQAPKGGFKHAGTKEPFATLEEAKAAAQADYEARIKAALED
ncbi:hypothetical protein [Phaeobacter piscinae]|uniref:hypothetical protein n=1 Tax=Phaeobacter piscinae TaxID=1580596 RepID=UPI000C9C59F8|nr:hypothetical protein [Phaeobacter piscinae]AUQ74795.1 hypothetical protein PhaeoP71_01934 [Phaeobacter piscinae]